MGGKGVHVTADSREESRKAARQSAFSGSYLHTPSPLLFHVKVCLGTCCIVFCSVNSSLPQDIHSLGVWSPHISQERKGLLPALINAEAARATAAAARRLLRSRHISIYDWAAHVVFWPAFNLSH